jgi:hypothetical protein
MVRDRVVANHDLVIFLLPKRNLQLGGS